jgi:sarcosine oxidase
LIVSRAGRANLLHDQCDFLGSTVKLAEEFGIAHSMLSASDLAARFPQLILSGDEIAYYEPGAGILNPEACVRAHLRVAARYGNQLLRYGETVREIRSDASRTIVETDHGTYTPGTTIICAGPWLPELVPALAKRLTVRRQVMYWFALDGSEDYSHDVFPIFIWPWGGGDGEAFYGFPQNDANGVASIKVATEQRDVSTTPSSVARDVTRDDIDAMYRRHVRPHLRGVHARCVKSATCLYTNAPQATFLIDRLPDSPNVIVVSACSGHGFKHSAAIGDAVARMVVTGQTPDVLAPFRLSVI